VAEGRRPSANTRDAKRAVIRAIKDGTLPEVFKGHEKELCRGAVRGGDIDQLGGVDKWIEWLGWACVVLDEDDYMKVAVHALRNAQKFAATDYGTSRQRDLGQLWADTIRGYLGETAFAKWLDLKFGIKVELDYSVGELEQYLPSDVKSVNGRKPRLNISIKTTKLSGIWLDVPGKQFEHSDAFVLVRIGVPREHFVAFLKLISAIKDKLLKPASEKGIISDAEAEQLWEEIPNFKPVPAYIAGFLEKSAPGGTIRVGEVSKADGEVKMRRRERRFVLNRFLGFWDPADSRYENEVRRRLSSKKKSAEGMPLIFEGIEHFSGGPHFIASSNFLKKKREEWQELIARL
jgi:hypothetical protein